MKPFCIKYILRTKANRFPKFNANPYSTSSEGQTVRQQVVKQFWRTAASPTCHPLWWRMDFSDFDPI